MKNDGIDEKLSETSFDDFRGGETVRRIGDSGGHIQRVRARSVMGSVTILMLSMPDTRRASTTEAKIPNGTVSSHRRNTPSFVFFSWLLILGPRSWMLMGSFPR